MQRRRLALVTAVAAMATLGTGPLGGSAFAASELPAGSAPSGFRAVDNPDGGRIVEGPLRGVKSTRDAFRAGLRAVSAYFGAAPRVVGAVRTADEKNTLALFTETLDGTAVTGLAIAAFDAKGGSRAAILFDTAGRFQTSLKPLVAQLQTLHARPSARGGESAAMAAPVPALGAMPFQDGTGSVSLPSDWRPVRLGQGAAVALGPDAQQIALGYGIAALDPNGSNYQMMLRMGRSSGGGPPPPSVTGLLLPYVADPVDALVAVNRAVAARSGLPEPHMQILHAKLVRANSAQVEGTYFKGAQRIHFSGIATTMPPNPSGGWLLSLFMLSCADESWARDKPTLVAIADSYRYNNAARSAQVNAFIAESASSTQAIMANRQKAGLATMDARFQSSMSHARAVQDGIDKSSAGVIRYVSGTDVVEHLATGAHATVDANVAQGLAASNPDLYRTVPVKEYRKGIDY